MKSTQPWSFMQYFKIFFLYSVPANLIHYLTNHHTFPKIFPSWVCVIVQGYFAPGFKQVGQVYLQVIWLIMSQTLSHQTNWSLPFVINVTLLIGHLLLLASSSSKIISSTLKLLKIYSILMSLQGGMNFFPPPDPKFFCQVVQACTLFHVLYVFSPELLDEASQALTSFC